jgi:toxin CcdB
MRQFDVFPNPSRRSSQAFPLVTVLQSDLVFETSSVLVAPFARADHYTGSEKLFPVFVILGQRLGLGIIDLAAIPRNLLRGEPVTNLHVQRDRIVAAIDRVFFGF